MPLRFDRNIVDELVLRQAGVLEDPAATARSPALCGQRQVHGANSLVLSAMRHPDADVGLRIRQRCGVQLNPSLRVCLAVGVITASSRRFTGDLMSGTNVDSWAISAAAR